MKITKTEFNQAKKEKFALEPAIKALMAINPNSLNYGTAEASELQAAIHFLAARLELAEGVIAATELQIKNRDEELISGALSLRYNITDRIRMAGTRKADLIEHHQKQVAELESKGFTSEQIEKICNYPAQEVAVIDAEIEALKTDEVKLNEYLNDSPIYDESFLDGIEPESIRDFYRMIISTTVNNCSKVEQPLIPMGIFFNPPA